MKVFLFIFDLACALFSKSVGMWSDRMCTREKNTHFYMLEGWKTGQRADIILALQEGKFSLRMMITVENETDPKTLSSMETNSLSLLTA